MPVYPINPRREAISIELLTDIQATLDLLDRVAVEAEPYVNDASDEGARAHQTVLSAHRGALLLLALRTKLAAERGHTLALALHIASTTPHAPEDAWPHIEKLAELDRRADQQLLPPPDAA